MQDFDNVNISLGERLQRTLLSVKGRVVLLCVVPMIAVVYFGASIALEKSRLAHETNAVVEAVTFAPVVSNLVHSLQAERGYSAGFLGQSSASFAEFLDRARPITDAETARVRTTMKSMEKHGQSTDFGGHLQTALTRLDQLASMRQQVSARALSSSDMATYYSSLIRELMEVADSASKRAHTVEMMRQSLAYVAITRAIEASGVERAQGASAFGNGSFSQDHYVAFVSQSAVEETQFDMFKHFAVGKELEHFEHFLSGAANTELEAIRHFAQGLPFGGSLRGKFVD